MAAPDTPWILGISASHNGAACLLKGDEIVVAVQEERLSGIKRQRICGADPALSLAYCLGYAGIEPRDLSLVVLCVQGRAQNQFHDIRANPFLDIDANNIPTLSIPHHYGHALGAFATSGFKESAVLVIDGTGSPATDFTADERGVVKQSVDDGWETISLYVASDTSVVPLEKHVVARGGWLRFYERGMPAFGSLGGMYSAVAKQIFSDPMEAGKVMGLAPYGTPSIPPDAFFDITRDGIRFKETVSNMFDDDAAWPARQSDYANLASSVQVALEAALLYLVNHLAGLSHSNNLCYAGGVALNSVANERILRESRFKNVYIMPAAEDSGTAIGAAYYGLWHLTRHNSRRKLTHDACGRPYSTASIASALATTRDVRVVKSQDVIADTVELLCDGKIVGWFDGRSELGPRALGQRSILCDARRADAKEVLNRRVKFREAFRPFAPVVLLEEVGNWFDMEDTTRESPFMLRVCRFKDDRRERVPAVAHVDGTGRVQTVERAANGRFYELVSMFHEKTGVPIILNTSFNVMGQPIVETPSDAVACLLRTGLDACVFEDCIVFKNDEPR